MLLLDLFFFKKKIEKKMKKNETQLYLIYAAKLNSIFQCEMETNECAIVN